MKVLTLIQPWATLIMLQEKQIETRSWSTNIRGQIAIHAGKKIDKKVFDLPYYREVFSEHGITPDNIVTSAIICTCNIKDVLSTKVLRDRITKKEFAFGNYDDNRFGWVIENVQPIHPIKNVKGMLGFWNYEIC